MAETNGKTDLFGGVALGGATLAALAVANSSLAADYSALLNVTAEVRIGSMSLAKSLEHWINDGLMAIFFLLVGLEIKREVISGALASQQKAALPVVAALGGFFVPAAIYGALNWGDAQALPGFAIPNGDRYRIRCGHLRLAWLHCVQHPGDLSACPGDHRRFAGDHCHRDILHR